MLTTNLPDGDAGSSLIDKSGVKPEYRTTLAERIGPRARSRLFEIFSSHSHAPG